MLIIILLIILNILTNRQPISFRVSTISTGNLNFIACYIDETEILDLINNERKSLKISPLKIDKRLESSAKLKLTDMEEKDYWNHIAPDGTTPWVFFVRSGYRYDKVGGLIGENLGRGFCNEKELFKAWKNSPTHYEVMVNPTYVDFGSAKDDEMIVNHFGALYH